MDTILDIALLVASILGFIVAGENIFLLKITPADWKWYRIVRAIIGFVWGIVYSTILINPIFSGNAGFLGPYVIRFLVIGTLMMILAEGVYTYRSRK